ncbi:hypothetical protein CHY_0450 [Carboxydothermus hydrogenoformans Z-2901]|uniref:Uncharacterized protein n=1 Tax=Carboxydothermus hydrogenoformans (strain ATCC BAA-161 / DSM 6008 / Z-2901) TaxID=246194 RepID=Q3AEX3_CARHZ|nr:hypothetical protein CHY_0450 [Carboxydothermus hydrogenoformans Z-2901]
MAGFFFSLGRKKGFFTFAANNKYTYFIDSGG